MKHKLKISVANESPKGGIVTCKKKKVKRGLFKRLFGIDPDKVTIIIPGDSVQDVTIQEVAETGGASQSKRLEKPMYQIGCVAFRFHARDYTRPGHRQSFINCPWRTIYVLKYQSFSPLMHLPCFGGLYFCFINDHKSLTSIQ